MLKPSHADELSVEQLQKLQYYVDIRGNDEHKSGKKNEVILSRETDSDATLKAGAQLVTREGHSYEIIRLKQGSAGVATGVTKDRNNTTITIAVSFEPGCSLEFSKVDRDEFELNVKRQTVEYCGQSYDYKVTSFARVRLFINLDSARKIEKNERVPAGRRVGDPK